MELESGDVAGIGVCCALMFDVLVVVVFHVVVGDFAAGFDLNFYAV